MSIISFPNSKIVSDNTIEINLLGKNKKEYYKTIFKNLDDIVYFNFLKATDPKYGMNIETQLPYYMRINVGVSTAKIIYYKKYPDDEDIDMDKYLIIEQNVRNGILN